MDLRCSYGKPIFNASKAERIIMGILKSGSEWCVSSWTTGTRQAKHLSFIEEARRSPEAVINRLMRQEEWEKAEWVMETFLH